MTHEFRFCPNCATPLALVSQMEDGGEKARLRCPACGFTHWNNPTPVLAAVIEYHGQVLLARFGSNAYQEVIGLYDVLALCFGLCFLFFVIYELIGMPVLHEVPVNSLQFLKLCVGSYPQ